MTFARPRTVIVFALYIALVVASLGRTPLWLDEVRQLGATLHRSIPELLLAVTTNAGAVPLGYLVQKAFLDLFGFSTALARVPAALASVMTGVVFLILSRRFALPSPALGLAIFLAVPLQFRYAVEARVYSLGLLLSLASLWAFLRLSEKPSIRGATIYGLTILLGLYSQPFTCFPIVGQLAWTLRRGFNGSVRQLAIVAATLSALLFLPWYFYEHLQQQSQGTLELYSFSWRQVTPLVLLHELTGGGYFCTLPLLILAACAWPRHDSPCSNTRLLYCILAISLAGPIVADAVFHYFFAARQLLFAVPSLVLLATQGMERLDRKANRWLGMGLLAVFFAAAAVADYNRATVSKDDFADMAQTMAARLTPDACVMAAPADQLEYYLFFHPELTNRACRERTGPAEILAAISPYTTSAQEKQLADTLGPSYDVAESAKVGRSRLITYRRR